MNLRQPSAGTPSPAFRGVVSILQRGALSLASLLLILVTATVVQAATPAFVQEKDRQINVGTSNSVAFSKPTAAGNLLVVYLIWDNTGSAAVSDSLANSYLSAAPATTWSNGRFSAQIFYAVNARSGADTVTATFGTAVKSFGIVYAHE